VRPRKAAKNLVRRGNSEKRQKAVRAWVSSQSPDRELCAPRDLNKEPNNVKIPALQSRSSRQINSECLITPQHADQPSLLEENHEARKGWTGGKKGGGGGGNQRESKKWQMALEERGWERTRASGGRERETKPRIVPSPAATINLGGVIEVYLVQAGKSEGIVV